MKSILVTIVFYLLVSMEAHMGQCFMLKTDRNSDELLTEVERVEKSLSKLKFLKEFLWHLDDKGPTFDDGEDRQILIPLGSQNEEDDNDTSTEKRGFDQQDLLHLLTLRNSPQKRQGVAPIWKEMCLAAGIKC